MSVQFSMQSLEGWLRELGPKAFLFRNDGAPKLEDLKAKLLNLFEQIEGVQAKADEEGRALSDEEKKELDDLWNLHNDLEDDIGRREKMEAAGERLSKSYGRRSEPMDTPQPGERAAEPKPTPGHRVETRLGAQNDRAQWGWQSFGQFAKAVSNATKSGGRIDPRLVANAPTSYGQEGVGADGGFAVPPDFRTDIVEKVMGPETLYGRTDQLTSSSNTVTIPVDETTPWQTSGGILAYWESEGGQLTQSKPALEPRSARLNKLTALVPVTEELLEDAPMIDSYLRRKAPEKMDYKISDAIVNGDGVGKPLGILNSGALISVTKDSGQAADTLSFNNLNSAYSRMYAPWRSGAIWLINQDVEPQLHGLSFPGDSRPVYMPAGGISGSPFGTIFGRPVVAHEVCGTIGDLGDVIFVNLGQYMTIRKVAGVRVDTSMHLFFDYDMTAFRFIIRIAGQPWWNQVITRASGSNTLSWAVAIAAR